MKTDVKHLGTKEGGTFQCYIEHTQGMLKIVRVNFRYIVYHRPFIMLLH